MLHRTSDAYLFLQQIHMFCKMLIQNIIIFFLIFFNICKEFWSNLRICELISIRNMQKLSCIILIQIPCKRFIRHVFQSADS